MYSNELFIHSINLFSGQLNLHQLGEVYQEVNLGVILHGNNDM